MSTQTFSFTSLYDAGSASNDGEIHFGTETPVSSTNLSAKKFLIIEGDGDAIGETGETGYIAGVFSNDGTSDWVYPMSGYNGTEDPIRITAYGLRSSSALGDLTDFLRFNSSTGFGLGNWDESAPQWLLFNRGDSVDFAVQPVAGASRVLQSVSFTVLVANGQSTATLALDADGAVATFSNGVLTNAAAATFTIADNANVTIDFEAQSITINGVAQTVPAAFWTAVTSFGGDNITIGAAATETNGFSLQNVVVTSDDAPPAPALGQQTMSFTNLFDAGAASADGVIHFGEETPVSSTNLANKRFLTLVGDGDSIGEAGETGYVSGAFANDGTQNWVYPLASYNGAEDPLKITAHGMRGSSSVGDLTDYLRFNATTGFGLGNWNETSGQWALFNSGDAVDFAAQPVNGAARILETISFTVMAGGGASSVMLGLDYDGQLIGYAGGAFTSAAAFTLNVANNAAVVINLTAQTITVNGVAQTAPAAFWNGLAAAGGDNLTIGAPLSETNGFSLANVVINTNDPGGANNAPVANPNTGAATEDAAAATGNVLTNDTDADNDALSVSAVNGWAGNVGIAIAGAYGVLTLSANGAYSYVATAQGLAAGQSATDSFTYTASDGHGGTASSTLVFTVTGANDAPIVANLIPDRAATEDAAFSFTVPANTFTDVDSGDALTWSATLANGSPLPSWLSFNASTHAFSGTPANGDVGSISVRVTATDGAGASVSDDFTITIANTNDAPIVAAPIPDQNASEDSAFSYVVPASTFTDVDSGDALTWSATLANGSPLPSWLSFNASTHTFTGTPANGDVGTISVRVTATDSAGASVSDTFDITTANTNDAPTLANAIADQSGSVGQAFSFTPPANTFADVDAGDTLTWSATLTDGSALPDWLSFNSSTHAFTGTPPSGTQDTTVSVRVTATDSSNASISDVFDIAIFATNTPPVLSTPIPDQNASEDAAFSYVVPANAFTDADVGDTLSYSATLADGSSLPSWLSFNAATHTFSGTPANGDVGAVTVRVTATDQTGAHVSDDFVITIANTNDAPTLANAIPDRAATEDAAFSFTVPANTFADVDAGDTLTWSATLANGAALPSWLSFNAATHTFSGTPANGDVGAISVRVNATDGAGASVSDDFVITIANTNDAPTLANAIADQAASEDSAFNYVVPANTFADVDAGDTLTWSATLSNGAPLPSWLSFNASTHTFSGTPANGDVGTISVRVTATDGSGASVSDNFDITTANTNDAPTLANAIADQNAFAGTAFSFTPASNTFADVDVGDTLTWSATLANGSPLPSWLSFNSSTHAFTGTPPSGAANSQISVRVTATDAAGATVSDNFDISIAGAAGQTLSFASNAEGVVANLNAHVWSEAATIMPLGDSITMGAATGTVANGYRAPLFQTLTSNNLLVNFVGDQSNGDSSFLDLDHAGLQGRTADQLLAATPGLISTYDPDAVLLLIGVNDINQTNSFTTLPQELRGIIDAIYAASPDTHIIIADIEPFVYPFSESAYDVAWNANFLLPSIVADAQADGVNVSIMHWPSITGADLGADGVHPNAQGYDEMAASWFTALNNYLNLSSGTPGGDGQTIAGNVQHLTGGAGNDFLIGDAQNNTLSGGGGNDQLRGYGGADTLTGGAGNDWFIFDGPANGADTITDFNSSADALVFSAAGFAGLVAGATPTLRTGTNPTVSGSGPQFLYNTATGVLSWDPDGTGSSPAVVIATLTGAPSLSASNLQVIDGPNDAPVGIYELPDLWVNVDHTQTIVLPDDLFADVDGDALTWTVTQSNGAALPSWINYNSATHTFTINATTQTNATIQVTATDPSGATGAATFEVWSFYNPTNGGWEGLVSGTSGDNTLSFQYETWWPQWFDWVRVVNAYDGSDSWFWTYTNVNTTHYDGGAGTDTLNLTSGADYISLRTDDATGSPSLISIERITAGAGDDIINLSDATLTYGDIYIDGGDGWDTLWSNAGNDTILGGAGNDIIHGGAGNDVIDGGADADEITGGLGADTLTGGTGNDRFIYQSPGEGGDTITDFTSGADSLHVFGQGFGIARGTPPPLVVGADPVSDGASFLYDTDNGHLYWDPDGAGGQAATLIATLSGAPALTPNDILIF